MQGAAIGDRCQATHSRDHALPPKGSPFPKLDATISAAFFVTFVVAQGARAVGWG